VFAGAATVGGGLSRIRELAHAFAVLAPKNDYLFCVKPATARHLPRIPAQSSFVHVPSRLSAAPLRVGWEQAYLPRLLRRRGVDWLLCPFNVAPLAHTPLQRAIIVSNLGPLLPTAVGETARYRLARNQVLRVLTYKSLRTADHVFLLSRTAHTVLAPRLEGKELTVLPMAPPSPTLLAQAARSTLPQKFSLPYFVFAGDLMRYKAAEEAIAAILDLEQRGSQAQLVVCGAALDAQYAHEMRVLAARSKRRQVVFLGSLPHADVLALLSNSTAAVVSSRLENPGRVFSEAMTVGAPVIAADTASTRETCGEAAAYYSAGDARALAEVMLRFIESPAARTKIIEAGHARMAGLDWLSASRLILDRLGLLY
jgi:glycosyltransferase involved in cell wall biosynthesis